MYAAPWLIWVILLFERGVAIERNITLAAAADRFFVVLRLHVVATGTPQQMGRSTIF